VPHTTIRNRRKSETVHNVQCLNGRGREAGWIKRSDPAGVAPLRPQFISAVAAVGSQVIRIVSSAYPALLFLWLFAAPTGAGEPTANLAPLPAEFSRTLPDGRVRLVAYDLGPAGPSQSGLSRFGARVRQPTTAWLRGIVRDRASETPTTPITGGYTEGEDATLTVGVRNDSGDVVCHVQLVLGDYESDRGPFDVLVALPGEQERLVARDVVVPAGAPGVLAFEAEPTDGRLTIRIRGRACRPWAATGLFVYAPPGSRLVPLNEFRDRRPPVPPPTSLAILDRVETTALLRRSCEFLLAERLTDGGFSHVGAWYQNAYPIRALLAGGRLLDEPAFTAAAFEQLDRFVEWQREDGRWYSTYFGSTECPGGPVVADTASANLADIGSMSLCLALAAPLADSARAARYLDAARRYADRVVLPEQLPDGAFPNRRWMGRDHRHPYSVATATQASSLAALGLATGDARYLEAAARAGLWLAANVRDDGSIAFRAHDREEAKLLKAHEFGDAFYIAEALTWILASADRLPEDGDGAAAATASRAALERYLFGARGLSASADHGYWWKPLSMWTSSKMAAVPYLLTRWREDGGAPGATTDTWIDRATAWLADPGLAQRIGVLAPYESMTGEYGLVATGFAAMGLAEVLEPGVLHPAASPASRVGATPRAGTSSHGPRPR
jgi:hypothetical protein